MSSHFESTVRELAREADVRIDGVYDSVAVAAIPLGESTNLVYIVPWENWGQWKFACLSKYQHSSISKFDKPLMAAALRQSGEEGIGYWCLHRVKDEKVLTYECRMAERDLDASTFKKDSAGLDPRGGAARDPSIKGGKGIVNLQGLW